jgi:hypothetical protein
MFEEGHFFGHEEEPDEDWEPDMPPEEEEPPEEDQPRWPGWTIGELRENIIDSTRGMEEGA